LSLGLVVEEAVTGYCGAVTRWENGIVVLEDRHGKKRSFPVGPGFLIDGQPVALTIPARKRPETARYTASGSLAGPADAPKVAQASRIYVEGKHDAELIEKVWGDDLRHIGVVVEPLGGIDNLEEIVAVFEPSPTRRLGVLVDHLLTGTKEQRIAEKVERGPWGADVLITGHEYVDIWQAVSPSALGISAWPVVPKGVEWKKGICQGLGWDYRMPADIAQGWRRILSRVKTWNDLDRAFVVEVEKLIDFVQEAADLAEE
jgi:hypothetical protein